MEKAGKRAKKFEKETAVWYTGIYFGKLHPQRREKPCKGFSLGEGAFSGDSFGGYDFWILLSKLGS